MWDPVMMNTFKGLGFYRNFKLNIFWFYNFYDNTTFSVQYEYISLF